MMKLLMILSSLKLLILGSVMLFNINSALAVCDATKPPKQAASVIKSNKRIHRIPPLYPPQFNVVKSGSSSSSSSRYRQKHTTISSDCPSLLSSNQVQKQQLLLSLSSLRGGGFVGDERHDSSDERQPEYATRSLLTEEEDRVIAAVVDSDNINDEKNEDTTTSNEEYNYHDDFVDSDTDEIDWNFDDDDDATFRNLDNNNSVDRLTPITSAYILSAFTTVTELSSLCQKWMILGWNKTIRGLQVWRPITTFLIFPQLVDNIWIPLIGFECMHQYEILHLNVPYDFWMIVLFGMVTSLVISNLVFNIPPDRLGYVFLSYMIYVVCRAHEREQFRIFKIRLGVCYLPWLLVASRLLMENKYPSIELSGIFIGHLFYHYTKVDKLIRTPKWFISWYKHSDLADPIREHYKKVS